MARRSRIPQYGTVEINGFKYYKTYVEDAEGKRIAIYGKTRQELYDKELEVQDLISNNAYLRKTPNGTVYFLMHQRLISLLEGHGGRNTTGPSFPES